MLRFFLLYLTLTLFFFPFSCRIEQREGLSVTIKQRVLFFVFACVQSHPSLDT